MSQLASMLPATQPEFYPESISQASFHVAHSEAVVTNRFPVSDNFANFTLPPTRCSLTTSANAVHRGIRRVDFSLQVTQGLSLNGHHDFFGFLTFRCVQLHLVFFAAWIASCQGLWAVFL